MVAAFAGLSTMTREVSAAFSAAACLDFDAADAEATARKQTRCWGREMLGRKRRGTRDTKAKCAGLARAADRMASVEASARTLGSMDLCGKQNSVGRAFVCGHDELRRREIGLWEMSPAQQLLIS